MFDHQAEPATYEEMIARAKAVKMRLGLIQPPRPVTIPTKPEPRKSSPPVIRVVLSTRDKKRRRRDAIMESDYQCYDLMRAGKPDNARSIINRFCEEKDIDPRLLYGRTQWVPMTRARHHVWAQLYQAGYSLTQIGRWFGRDHTTVLSGIRGHKKRDAPIW